MENYWSSLNLNYTPVFVLHGEIFILSVFPQYQVDKLEYYFTGHPIYMIVHQTQKQWGLSKPLENLPPTNMTIAHGF